MFLNEMLMFCKTIASFLKVMVSFLTAIVGFLKAMLGVLDATTRKNRGPGMGLNFLKLHLWVLVCQPLI